MKLINNKQWKEYQELKKAFSEKVKDIQDALTSCYSTKTKDYCDNLFFHSNMSNDTNDLKLKEWLGKNLSLKKRLKLMEEVYGIKTKNGN